MNYSVTSSNISLSASQNIAIADIDIEAGLPYIAIGSSPEAPQTLTLTVDEATLETGGMAEERSTSSPIQRMSAYFRENSPTAIGISGAVGILNAGKYAADSAKNCVINLASSAISALSTKTNKSDQNGILPLFEKKK